MAPAHSAPLCSCAYQSGTKMKKSPALSTEFGSNTMRVGVSLTSTSSLARSTQSGFLIERKVGGEGGLVGGGGGAPGGELGGGGARVGAVEVRAAATRAESVAVATVEARRCW